MTINANELIRGGTVCLSKAGLAIGSTASQIAIAAPNGAGVDFAINGKLYHKADAATAAVTAATAQAADTVCAYTVCLNSSGTVSTVKGTEQTVAAVTAGTAVVDVPLPTADTCPIGYIIIETDGVTFTAGTTEFSATGITDTYVDIYNLPVSPLGSSILA